MPPSESGQLGRRPPHNGVPAPRRGALTRRGGDPGCSGASGRSGGGSGGGSGALATGAMAAAAAAAAHSQRRIEADLYISTVLYLSAFI